MGRTVTATLVRQFYGQRIYIYLLYIQKGDSPIKPHKFGENKHISSKSILKIGFYVIFLTSHCCYNCMKNESLSHFLARKWNFQPITKHINTLLDVGRWSVYILLNLITNISLKGIQEKPQIEGGWLSWQLHVFK